MKFKIGDLVVVDGVQDDICFESKIGVICDNSRGNGTFGVRFEDLSGFSSSDINELHSCGGDAEQVWFHDMYLNCGYYIHESIMDFEYDIGL